MSSAYFSFFLDVTRAESQVSIPIKAGDTERVLAIFLKRQGRPFPVPMDAIAVVSGKKPDDTAFLARCAVRTDRILFPVPDQATAAAGVVDCELQLFRDGGLLTSARFRLAVDDAVNAGGEITSTDDFSALRELMGQVSEVIQGGGTGGSGSGGSAPGVSWLGNYVTPEDYGAVGDGVHDDAPALKAALETEKEVILTKDLWLFSDVRIADKNVKLNGAGFTLHVDGAQMEGHMNKMGAVRIFSSQRDGDGGPVRLVRDSVPWLPEFPNYHYRRGYISYRGFNPTPDREEYENPIITSWDEHSCQVRNVKMLCRNMEVMSALEISRMCHVVVENCAFDMEPGHEGGVGLNVLEVYDAVVSGVRASGWTAYNYRSVWTVGYGMQMAGDAIRVENCLFQNNKHGMVFGGVIYFVTGLVVNNVVLQVDYASDLRPSVFMQAIDVHPAVHNPVFSNISVEISNANDKRVYVLVASCPNANFNNISVSLDNVYNRGVISVGTGCQLLRIHNLHAPRCFIQPRGSGFERQNVLDGNYIQEIDIVGGIFSGVENGEGSCHLRLHNVTVTGRIRNLERLTAVDMKLIPTEYGDVTLSPLHIMGEAWISASQLDHCHIPDTTKATPLIRAPEDGVHLSGCRVRKRPECPVFSSRQTDVTGLTVADLFGFVLGLRTDSDLVLGDACTLDENNLWWEQSLPQRGNR